MAPLAAIAPHPPEAGLRRLGQVTYLVANWRLPSPGVAFCRSEPPVPDETSAASGCPWELVTSPARTQEIALSLVQCEPKAVGVAIATVAHGQAPDVRDDPRRAEPKWLAVSMPGVSDKPGCFVFDLERPNIIDPLAPVLAHPTRAPYVVFHDAHAELHLLGRLGVVPSRFGSTQVAATFVLESDGSDVRADDLSACAVRFLSVPAWEHATALARNTTQVLAHRSTVLVPLLQALTPRLRSEGLAKLYELECKLLPAVVAMETAGIAIDAARFQRIAESWAREHRDATDRDRISRLDKLISTYGHWPRDFVELDGRIHCRLHPLATESGRFSCSEPNLQQVPSARTAPGLRGCFVPAPGHRFVVADYAQIELRVAAHLAPCHAMRDVFLAGRDPHRATAATLAHKSERDVDAHERKLAKAVNFGFLFGMGAARFREYAHTGYGVELTPDAAKHARDAFFATFPGIASWHRRVAELGHEAQHTDVVVKTALGRRKRFARGRFSFNAALNIPVQGTAAEGFKLAMIELHRVLTDIGGRGVLCIHDEYLAEVPEDRAIEACALVRATMEECMARLVTSVPIHVEATVAEAWED